MARGNDEAVPNQEDMMKMLDSAMTSEELEKVVAEMSREEMDALAKEFLETANTLQDVTDEEAVLANPNEVHVLAGTDGTLKGRKKHAMWVAGELNRLKNS